MPIEKMPIISVFCKNSDHSIQLATIPTQASQFSRIALQGKPPHFLLAKPAPPCVRSAAQPKNHMKKITATLFALTLAIGSLGTVGCGGAPPPDPNATKEGAKADDGMTDDMKKKAKEMGFTSGQGSDTNTPGDKPKGQK